MGIRRFYINRKYTFHNNGSNFQFTPSKITRNPFGRKPVSLTMLEVHAELAAEAMLDGKGKTTYISDMDGKALTWDDLTDIKKTGTHLTAQSRAV
jgi:hypothetical protein